MKNNIVILLLGAALISLSLLVAVNRSRNTVEEDISGIEAAGVVQPLFVSETVQFDSDDPAIWVHPSDPEKSLVIGTDKHDPGGLYVFDLNGRIVAEKVVRNLRRPNNVDVEYGFMLNGKPVDIAVTTERLRHRIRIFSLPDMAPVDNGGIEVFVGEEGMEYRAPMGVALYKRPEDGTVFAIVGRKNGPANGYLWQYRLSDNGSGHVQAVLERKFGTFSGVGEIEAIAVDDSLGYVYYSDESAGIRKYHANPEAGDEELAVFGLDNFTEDREGISIFAENDRDGYIIVSDQQANSFNIYNRLGPPGNPHSHKFIKKVKTSVNESDGSEVIAVPLNDRFQHGLFVAMSDDRTFHYYRWEDMAGDIINEE